MFRRCVLMCAFVTSVALAFADDATQAKPTLPDGNYLVSYGSSPTVKQRFALIKIENKDGKYTGTVESAGPGGRNAPKVSAVAVEGSKVTVELELGAIKLSMTGTLDTKTPGLALGTFGDAERPMRGYLEPTKLEKLEQKDMIFVTPANETMKKMSALRAESSKLAAKLRTEKDAEAKKKLQDEIAEITKANEPKITELLREQVKDENITIAATTASELLRSAKKINASEADVQAWAKLMEKEAAQFGPAIINMTKSQIASTLVDQENYGKLALTYLGDMAKDTKQPKKAQYATLKMLAKAQTQAGLTDDAKATTQQLVAIDAELDKEYLATVPPFKPTPYTGRKDKSANQVVVMELFTGAQCPPCVAADVAFDGLIKAYSSKDVVFLQYHEHIPGPDPLTNQDTIDRMGYYREIDDKSITGTPSTLFNGKKNAGGGGGMANAEAKYKEYAKLLDEALEKSTEVKLNGTALRDGEDIKVTVEVAGIKEAKELKLRLVLIEANIKYVGGNGLRFHHHVVRSLMGTGKGVAVSDLKEDKYTTKVSLADVKAETTKYLDTYAATRPFPYPERPLDLKGLSVVAMIQNDETGEIVQAIQFDLDAK